MRQLSSLRHQMSRRAASSAQLSIAAGHAPAAWAQESDLCRELLEIQSVYSRAANGAIAPSLTIPAQLGDAPHQIAINHRAGELIVANNIANSVAVYDLASGARKRTISGLDRPTGVAVDEAVAAMRVANDLGNSITVYDVIARNDSLSKRTIRSS